MNGRNNSDRQDQRRQESVRQARSFRSYLFALLRVLRWKFALAVGAMVCSSLTEGLGLLLLVPLLQLVGLDVSQGVLNRIAQILSSAFSEAGIRPTLITVLAAYVLIISAHGLLQRWQTGLTLGLQYAFVASLRRRLYEAITRSNWVFFCRSRSSDFAHVLTTEVERVGAATYCLLQLLATGLVGLVYLLFAFKLSATMVGLVVACGGVLGWLLHGKIQMARETGEGLSRAMSSLYAAMTEHLGGMKTARSYGAESRHIGLFTKLADDVRQTCVGAVQNQTEVKYWFDVGSVAILSVILYVSLEILKIPTAGALLLVFLFARIMPRFAQIQQTYQGLVNHLPAFARVQEMQTRCEAAAEPAPQTTETIELRQAIRLEHVSFAYEKTPVIHGLDLTVRAGECVAIVGPSGAGKSTVADLMIGLIRPTEGRILVDGVPLGPERIKAWRDQIGYVPQDSFLFHDTVRANLLWARPEASDEDLRKALRLAGADDFVSQLPAAMETTLGDRGVRLSGGERQRLALARALLRKPALLILDEATSHLDFENEKRILSAIEQLHGHMTILFITHRLSAIRGADVIYVLEQGHLVESGGWDDLWAAETGCLRALYNAQDTEMVSG